MARLPIASGNDIVKALEKEGFVFIRQHGSHIVLQKKVHNGSITVVVPNHKELALGTLKSILKKSGISTERLVELLTLILGLSIHYW